MGENYMGGQADASKDENIMFQNKSGTNYGTMGNSSATFGAEQYWGSRNVKWVTNLRIQ
eukprot:gene23673-9868_t